VVSLVKPTWPPHARAPVILCSRARELASATLRDDDRLRCQSEFTCRDATQDWGLEDCMHVTPRGVTHAATLSWFMVTVSSRLPADVPPRDPDDRILDLKADGRGDTYVEDPMKMLPEKPAPIF
jgi:putative transposase